MAHVDGSINIDAKLNRSDFFKGVEEIKGAIKSLQSTVEEIGKKIGTSTVIHIRDIGKNVESLEGKVKDVSDNVDTLNNSTSQTVENTREIEAAMEKTVEATQAMEQANSGSDENISERISALEQEAEQLTKVRNHYIELLQYAGKDKSMKRASTYLNSDAGQAHYQSISRQISDITLELSKLHEIEAKTNGENMEMMAENADKAKESVSDLNNTLNNTANSSTRVQEQNVESLNDAAGNAKTEVGHFMSAAKEFFAATKGFQETADEVSRSIDTSIFGYAKSTEQGAEAIRQLESEFEKLKAQRDALVKERSAIVSGGKMDNDQKQLSSINEKIRAVEEELKRMENIKDSAVRLKPSFSEEWEKMPTITGRAVEMFSKLKNTAQMTLYGIQHPLQSLNRALSVAADGAMKFAGSLTKAIFSGVANTLKSIGQSAIRAAANLARMAGSGALSFLRRLATGAKNAAIQLAKMVSSAVISGLKRLGSFAARAAKAVTNMGKSTDSTSLKDGLKLIIRYGFGVRSLFMLVRRLRSAIAEAFNNMAQKVPEVNETISRLASSLDRLKNSLATAFQPILTAVEPILTKFMDYLSDALTQVGMFFAALTGQDYVYKATKAQINYAESLDKTKKKAKEAQNQLAGFDHLNILSDTSQNDSDSSTNTDKPTSDFEKLPINSKIFDFVQKLKEAFKNGQLYEVGRQFADFVNGFVKNTVKWEKIGRVLGKTINGIVDVYNGFMDNVDWEELGKGFGKTIDGLLDSVNWGELGRALSQKINAIFGILWGIVQDENRWKKAGRALAEAVAGYFGNIKWDLIGKVIGTAINGIADLITEFATHFPWGEMGEKIREGFELLVATIDINKIYQAFSSLLKGILDLITPIITDTATWNKIANDFKTFLFNFFTDNELWSKAKTAIIGGFRTLLTSLNTVFGDQSLFTEIAGKLSDFLNSIIGDETIWKEVGQLANNMMKDILSFGEKFINDFDPDTAAQNIQTALNEIEWGNIATWTWDIIKTAFSKTGSFVDALFSENTSDLSGRALEEANSFNAKPLGQRMALKFKAVFGDKALWEDIASTIWGAMQTAFTVAGDFIGVLLGVDTANMDAKEKLKVIGDALGAKLGELANTLGNELAKIDWKGVFSVVADVVKEFIDGLLGNESGNGKVLLWIVGGFAALKLGLVPIIAKLIAGLAAGIAAGGPVLSAAIVTLCVGAITAGTVYLIKGIGEMQDLAVQTWESHKTELETVMDLYIKLFQETGAESANAMIKSYWGIELEGNNLRDNLEKIGHEIADQQGETFQGINADAKLAMEAYKKIFNESGAEAANKWAEDTLKIKGFSDDMQANLETLNNAIAGYAMDGTTNVSQLVVSACKDILTEGTETTETLKTAVAGTAQEIETVTNESATKTKDNVTGAFEGTAQEIKPNLKEIEQVVNDATGDMVKDVESNMNEQSRVYDEKTAEMYNKANRHWNDIKSVQETANSAMTGNLSSTIDEMARTDTTGHDSQYKEYYDHYGKIMYIVDTCMADAASYMKQHMDEMVKHAQQAMNQLVTMNWDYIGTSIINGIARGINNGWGWLNTTVWNLAVSLFNTAKAALGIASPSKVFRDKVGAMIGLGIAEGIDDSGSNVVESLTDLNKEMVSSGDIFTFGISDTELKELFDSMVKVTEQTQDEIKSKSWTAIGEYITDGIRDGIANNWNELENFVNDRIDSLYSSFNERLQAMADTVSFRMPSVATGTVVPYSVQGGVATTSTRDTTAILEQNNEELISVITQNGNNWVAAIVRAIQEYSTTEVNISDKTIGDASIREINRRTKAFGTSPLSI